MTDLVEQLRAQAVELRDGADGRDVAGAGPLQRSIAEQHRSLVYLINGMLAVHTIASEGDGSPERPPLCECDDPAPCPSLRLLARHVSRVLSGYTQTAREAQ